MSYSEEILDFQEEKFESPELHLAPSGKRFANYILDRIGLNILLVGIVFLVDFLPTGTSTDAEDEIGFLFLLVFLLLMGAYWVLPEYYFGKSPAKFLTRTKVVTKHGKRPTFMTIVGRTLCRLIPFEPFSFLGNKPIGWHDSISKTRVVNDSYNTREEYY